jgi:hypothetical protein
VNARPSTTQVWTNDYRRLVRAMSRADAIAFARPLSLDFQQIIANDIASRFGGPVCDVLREVQTVPAGMTFTDIDAAASAAATRAARPPTPRRGTKSVNAYQRALGSIFDDCPKTVCAAIAVSILTCGGDHLDQAKELFAAEWDALFQAGIVSQRPSKSAAAASRRAHHVPKDAVFEGGSS